MHMTLNFGSYPISITSTVSLNKQYGKMLNYKIIEEILIFIIEKIKFQSQIRCEHKTLVIYI